MSSIVQERAPGSSKIMDGSIDSILPLALDQLVPYSFCCWLSLSN